jgi:class 3 adenylate cyclase
MLDLSTLGLTEIVRLQNQLQQELRRRFERTLLMAFLRHRRLDARTSPASATRSGRQLHQLHFDLLGQAAGDATGRVVDAVGDGVFCVFPDAAAGVRGIVAFQQALARENASRAREHQLAVRIGLHWGSVPDRRDARHRATRCTSRRGSRAPPSRAASASPASVFLEFDPACACSASRSARAS